MRPAEAAAQRFVIEMAYDLGYAFDADAPSLLMHGATPNDAIRIALSFVRLAHALDTLCLIAADAQDGARSCAAFTSAGSRLAANSAERLVGKIFAPNCARSGAAAGPRHAPDTS